jgi:hypothetical protein
MSTLLTTHFSLDELTVSQVAARQNIYNVPNDLIIRNLTHLAEQLEIVRSALGNLPIVISSGYRSKALNKAVGSSAWNSAHRTGLAADFTAPRFGTVLETAKKVAACGIEYDQIIYEFGRWVHLAVALPDEKGRKELLSIKYAGSYIKGLVDLG